MSEFEGQTNPEEANVENEGEVIADVSGESSESTPSEAVAENTEPVAWTPDTKFKYFGQEGELDEKLKGLITNADEEKYYKDLARKAKSFDYLRETSKIDDFKGDSFTELLQSKKTLDEHYKPLEENYNNMMNNLATVDKFIAKKDYTSFFDTLKINSEDIIKWAANELYLKEAPPQEREAILKEKQQNEYYESLQEQNQTYAQMVQNQSIETRRMQLDFELSKPEISSFATQFDSLTGTQGKFREEVIKQGNIAYHMEGIDLPVGEAVRRVLEHYSAFANGQTQAPQVPNPTVTATQTPKTNANGVVTNLPDQKPTLPKVQGGSTSPVKHVVRSLDDIRKIRAQLES